jgi:hypothetical protein
MSPRIPLLLVVACLAGSAIHAAVTVEVETMTLQVGTKPMGPRGAKTPQEDLGAYSLRGAEEVRVPDAIEVIKLNNGWVEAWVAPAYGMRLLRAFDPKTGVDYFSWTGEWNTDYLGFGTGGVEPSFPFFEHGARLRQPAGYRVVHNAAGSVTVAMDQRFTQHRLPRDRQRYGRFTEESLNVMVTVFPDSSVVEYRMRKENPTPLPRSSRLWNCATLNFDAPMTEETVTDKKSGEVTTRRVADRDAVRARYKILYPARWVTDHGPTQVHTSPHWSNPSNWDVSHFAIDAPYGLMGVFDAKRSVSFLRFNDPATSPAAKLYSAFWGIGPKKLIVELWGGKGLVFESPDELFPPYAPVEAVNQFAIAQGLGEVTHANAEIAVSAGDGFMDLLAFRPGILSVTYPGGTMEGPSDPRRALRVPVGEGELRVSRDGKAIYRQTFPLERPLPAKETPVPEGIQQTFEALRDMASKHPLRFEREQVMHNEGAATAFTVLSQPDPSDPAVAASFARTAYRLGDFAKAGHWAGLADSAEGDVVLALLAMEEGQPLVFGRAGPEMGYARALLALRDGKAEDALRHVDAFLAVNPRAFRPRLARALWARDQEAAKALAAENPGSPEAQLVLERLGVDGAATEKEKLLANNPGAREQVEDFLVEVTTGAFKPLQRYGMPQTP